MKTKKSEKFLFDPIVSEVRAIRDRLAAAHNYDVEAIIRDLMDRQKQISEGHRMVRDANDVSAAPIDIEKKPNEGNG